MKKFEDMTPEELEILEKAAIGSANNFGKAQHLWHPDYGWILKDGKVTDIGIKFYENLAAGNYINNE